MKFKVGEIAICIGFFTGIRRECEILALPRDYLWVSENGKEVSAGNYLIRVSCLVNKYGGDNFQCSEPYLRKRPERGIPKEVRDMFENPIEIKA